MPSTRAPFIPPLLSRRSRNASAPAWWRPLTYRFAIEGREVVLVDDGDSLPAEPRAPATEGPHNLAEPEAGQAAG